MLNDQLLNNAFIGVHLTTSKIIINRWRIDHAANENRKYLLASMVESCDAMLCVYDGQT